MTNEQIRERLLSLSDIKYKDFSAKLTPGEENIIGVRVPLIKQLAKELAKGEYLEYLQAPNTTYHEECLLWGLTLGYIKTDISTLLSYIDKWLPCVNNWAVCDSTVMGLKALGINKNSEIVWQHLLNILKTTANPYAKRFSLVAMFCYFLDDKYAIEVADIYANQHDEHYYIRMAIAWGLSVVLVKQYTIGLSVLQGGTMPIWTHNKAIQKARESYRLTDEQKTEVSALKR